MLKLSLQLLFILISSQVCLAQNEFNVWHFSNASALDFNSGSPVVLYTSSIGTLEGSASICDSAGQILFYTDGSYVWDRTDGFMLNGAGLQGDESSTQSALICPDPGNISQYYIFTADQGGYAGPNSGVHYCKVDMSQNSGLGEVVTSQIQLLPPPATEKITAVRHNNGIDFWIITHPFNSNTFQVFLLSASGVNSAPVISAVGMNHYPLYPGFYGETIGYMKASPNGKKLALANLDQAFVEIFDFDNSTGTVSNAVTIQYPLSILPYGISFSPNSSLLYSTVTAPQTGTSYIYQYDISNYSASSIIASQYIAASVTNSNGMEMFAALQLGPDGKIYAARDNMTLDVISSPDAYGSGCGYSAAVVTFPSWGQIGLPNCIDAFHAVDSATVIQPDPPALNEENSIANFFTPNGDAVNDNFLVYADSAENYNMSIFSRWGDNVYSTTDQFEGWNGYVENKPAVEGTYYWTLYYQNSSGIVEKKSGFVLLTR